MQMNGGSLPASVKRTSALRRVPPLDAIRFRSECGSEGDVCAFELPQDAFVITVEAPGGRANGNRAWRYLPRDSGVP
jgi:hypothetical protein